MNFSNGVSSWLPVPGGAFPRSMALPIIGAAVDEAERNIMAPRALIYSAALPAMATAAQASIDVCKPNGQIGPVSIMVLTVANSGERKSTAENVFMGGVRRFQDEMDVIYQSELSDWRAKQSIWDARRKAILKETLLLDQSEGGDPNKQLMEHQACAPIKPRRFKLLYEDATSEALFLGLHQNIPVAGLISSEGGGVLTGKAFNDLSKQNALWSGDTITVDRVSAESYEVRGRLTVSLMVQESSFFSYMEKNGEKSRGSGLWARFLVCSPESTQGTRFITEGAARWDCCDRFSERVGEILKSSVEFLADPKKPKLVVRFSLAAIHRWVSIFNGVEAQIKPGGRYFGMGDHASKLADNIARVAAIFHFFEKKDGDIAVETLEAAIDVCFWYSDEFLRMFSLPPQDEADALELDDWLQLKRESGEQFVAKNLVLQKGPGHLRKVKRLDPAIEVLVAQGKVLMCKFENVTYLNLFPERSMSNMNTRCVLAPFKPSI
ncbi:MAG: YfjI family protein [Pseudomonas sp.]|uniref:YfjI family protein n=1 Tax=Pseudomonas sp. TaxID=306 RepID=UPI003D6E8164